MRRFVIVGSRAVAHPDFSLDDLPSTSGRLDVLLAATRAALLTSHAVRRDVVVDLVLAGEEHARVVRIDGALAQFLRPDERSLGVLVKKALGTPRGSKGAFVALRNGVSIADGAIAESLADLPENAARFVLDEAGEDVREVAIEDGASVFFVGDHTGFTAEVRREIERLGARAISIGPVAVQAGDAIAVLTNELDRRRQSR